MSQAQDEAVIATNDDATACKRFAVQKGYWEDKYIQYFVKSAQRKTPEISRGYYARVKGVHHLVHQLLSLTESQCQIVSLGAGFDTLFWQLKESGSAPTMYVEVDFSAVTGRKSYTIRMRKQLREVFTEDDNLVTESSEVHSKGYHVVPADLRDIETLDTKFNEIGLDKSLPTMFLVECVFVYMLPEHSTTVIDWIGQNFSTALFVNYEQVNMQDKFGQVMIQNLKGRDCSLVGALSCPDLHSQKQRFLLHGWQGAEALGMNDVYKYLPRGDVERIEKLEFLDEVDLLHQLLSHYCISWAYNDSKQLGLSSIGY